MEYLQEGKNYKEKTIKEWDKFVETLNVLIEKKKENKWIFRGHIKKDYLFQTYLERAIAEIGIEKKNSVFDIEKGLIRRFQRQYYHFDLQVPPKDNKLEWLALMRHYGAPTRLLDWTYSFYIAITFHTSFMTQRPGNATRT